MILNFGAVDYQARVYVNGSLVTTHVGGFSAFSADITNALKDGENTLAVLAIDNTDETQQPVGKQRFNPGGAGSIFYNQVSGIWQTVWLEPVAPSYITEVRTTPDVDQSTMSVLVNGANTTAGDQVKVTLKMGSATVATGQGAPGSAITLNVPNAQLWSPANPSLYDLDVTLVQGGQDVDNVKSYAAMRKISARQLDNGEWHLQLNNRDLFHNGVLDQGYWPDGLYTAPTDEALLYDIQKAKDLGFNMIRKHMKVEPARWYYHCDRLGMMVWQDMPGLGRSDEPWVTHEWSTKNGSQPSTVETYFKRQWKEIIDQLYSVPSIVVWTPFNESWGQFKTKAIVDYTRELDNTRLIDAASGGNHVQGVGDMVDLHDYDNPPHIYLYDPQRPVVLGEYGGMGRNIEGHRWYDLNTINYSDYSTEAQLTNAYAERIDGVLALAQNGKAEDGGNAAFGAAVYTQICDVETEVNGIMTYDRELVKMNEEKVREANLEAD